MFKHYIKTTLNILLKFKLFSFINILGLSIGLCISLLIFLYASHELSYDKHIKDIERIYLGTYDGSTMTVPSIGVYEDQIPEIDVVSITRPYLTPDLELKYKDKIIINEGFNVDSNFLKVYQHEALVGNPSSALQRDNSIVLTESIAKKLFGDENPLGKEINVVQKQIDYNENLVVDLVIEDLKSTNSLHFGVLVHDPSIRNNKDKRDRSYLHYIKLKEGADPKKVERAFLQRVLPLFEREDWIEHIENRPDLCGFVAVQDIHFNIKSGTPHTIGDKKMVYIFLTIGILILMIACFNFINLSSSIASKRHKEIGIKKTLGATKSKLFWQLTAESVFTTLIALAFAIILLEITSHYLIDWLNITFKLDVFGEQVVFFLFILVLTIALGVLSGLYPAAVLSSYQPIAVAKGEMSKGRKGLLFKRTLIVVQFVISVFLIIFSTVVFLQLNHIKNEPLGFNKDHIASFYFPRTRPTNKELRPNDLIAAFEQCPYIEKVAFAYCLPDNMITSWGREYNGNAYSFAALPCDDRFLDIMGIEVIKGRAFEPEDSKHQEAVVIINEEAEKTLGDDHIIGKRIGGWKVVGVCKNFYVQNPALGHKPVMLHAQKSGYKMRRIVMKLSPNTYAPAISYVKDYMATNFPEERPEVQFLDKNFDRNFQKNEELSRTFLFFAILAIFIACLGLFGLSAFMAEQRTKEIAIRKVLGVENAQLMQWQTKEYVILVIIGNLIAWPIAFYAANLWLDQFVNHVNFDWYIFPIALTISLVISLLTVSYISIKVSRMNPIDAIKCD